MAPKNVFLIGRDDLNFAKLQSLQESIGFRLHVVLDYEQVQGERALPAAEILNRAETEIVSIGGTVDAIISLWDFPVGVCCRSCARGSVCLLRRWKVSS